jgi:hypothetical protein
MMTKQLFPEHHQNSTYLANELARIMQRRLADVV